MVLDLALAVVNVFQSGTKHCPTGVTSNVPLRGMLPHVFQRQTATLICLRAGVPLALQVFLRGLLIERKLILHVVVNVGKKLLSLDKWFLAIGPFAGEFCFETVDTIPPTAVAVASWNADYPAQTGSVRFDPIVVHMKVHMAL